jgi:hypothetical protein
MRRVNSEQVRTRAETRARAALLKETRGALSPQQRAEKIDEVCRIKFERRIREEMKKGQLVYRYLSKEALDKALASGVVSGYATTEFSVYSAEVAKGAQILPDWSVPEYGLAIPIDQLKGITVARAFGNHDPGEWEPLANSYPEAGDGGWMQFLIKDVPIAQAFYFKLDP